MLHSVDIDICHCFADLMLLLRICKHLSSHCFLLIFVSAKEVLFSRYLFLCLLAGLCRNYSTDVPKFGRKVAMEEPIRFEICVNLDHSVLGLGMVTVMVDVARHICQDCVVVR